MDAPPSSQPPTSQRPAEGLAGPPPSRRANADGLAGSSALRPRLRLLYHEQLTRVGAVSPLADGDWQIVGRRGPPFDVGGCLRPLDDGTISREQFRLRWSASRRLFELNPNPTARLTNRLLSLGSGGASAELTGPVELPPGSCVAIGDQVLLGLEEARPRPCDADRLGLVGESETLWTLRDEIRDVGLFARPVLIEGPTGSGKELVAQAIHRQSPRAQGPFVPIHCAALPGSLLESLAFGHARGADLFAAADGGTLLLDEIGELPASLQPLLLRALQDSPSPCAFGLPGPRFRLVAASSRDLRSEVAAGRLREDFYHRIAAHVVRLPPLAARRFDVPELFVHFLAELTHERSSLAPQPAQTALPSLPIHLFEDLLRQPWTGNIRELRNAALRAFVSPSCPAPPAPWSESAAEPQRHPSAEPPRGGAARGAPCAAEASSAPSRAQRVRIGQELGLASKTVGKLFDGPRLDRACAALDEPGREQRRERLRALAAEALQVHLEAHGGNHSRTAAALSVSRTTLLRMRKFR